LVEEGGLSRSISILRKALGEQPEQHHDVVTVPGRGYQFAAEVRQATGDPEDVATRFGPGKDVASGRTMNPTARRMQLIALTLAVCGAAAQRLISTFPGSHRTPTLSPDGTRVAFVNVVSGSIPQVWITAVADGQARTSIWAVSPGGGTPHKQIGSRPQHEWVQRR
jgi:hypothetical protein